MQSPKSVWGEAPRAQLRSTCSGAGVRLAARIDSGRSRANYLNTLAERQGFEPWEIPAGRFTSVSEGDSPRRNCLSGEVMRAM